MSTAALDVWQPPLKSPWSSSSCLSARGGSAADGSAVWTDPGFDAHPADVILDHWKGHRRENPRLARRRARQDQVTGDVDRRLLARGLAQRMLYSVGPATRRTYPAAVERFEQSCRRAHCRRQLTADNLDDALVAYMDALLAADQPVTVARNTLHGLIFVRLVLL